jgi:ribosomal protein S18 acetylase RimI-like enzyme
MTIHCKELFEDTEFASLYPLIRQLNETLSEDEYAVRLQHMRADGYRCVGAYHKNTLVGASGFWIGWRFWCGKYIDMDNFVVDANQRGKGIGRTLLTWLEEKGREEQCDQMVLDAYMTNFSANKFYVQNNFLQLGYHMIKPLNAQGKLPDAAYQNRLRS